MHVGSCVTQASTDLFRFCLPNRLWESDHSTRLAATVSWPVRLSSKWDRSSLRTRSMMQSTCKYHRRVLLWVVISKEVRLHLPILWRTFLDVSTHLGDISMVLAQQWAPRQHNQTQSPLSTRQQAAIVPWSPTSPPPPTASSATLPQIKTNISPKKPGQSPNGSESGWRHILLDFWALIGWLDHGKFLAGWIFLAAAALTWGFLLFTFILGTL